MSDTTKQNQDAGASEPQQVGIGKAEFGPLTSGGSPDSGGDSLRNLEFLYEIPLSVNAELGRTKLTLKELLELGPGAIVELDRLAGESVDLLVNGVLIGRGDVVVVNENFGIRVTEIVGVKERLEEIAG